MSNIMCGPITEIEPGEFWCEGCKAYADDPTKLIHDGRDQRKPKEDDLGWSDVEKLSNIPGWKPGDPLDLRIEVHMGGSHGTWRFTDAKQIIKLGEAMSDLLGEPNVSLVEDEGALSSCAMAMQLLAND